MLQKVKAIYSGRVQGVGFRVITQQISRDFPVAGTVRNVADGTVELVAVAERSDLEQFLMAIDQRMSRNIENCLLDWMDGIEGEFVGFSILSDKMPG